MAKATIRLFILIFCKYNEIMSRPWANLAPSHCFFVSGATSWTVEGLKLSNQVTTKPRLTKFSSSTTELGSGALVTPTSSSGDSGVAYYRLVNSNSGTTCILLKTDAVVEVSGREWIISNFEKFGFFRTVGNKFEFLKSEVTLNFSKKIFLKRYKHTKLESTNVLSVYSTG